MVQSVDNLTELRGTIIDRVPHPTLSGYGLVRLQVDSAEPVVGLANLLGQYVGSVLPVAIREELLGGVASGAALRLRAKMTPDGAMAERDPAPAHFQIGP